MIILLEQQNNKLKTKFWEKSENLMPKNCKKNEKQQQNQL